MISSIGSYICKRDDDRAVLNYLIGLATLALSISNGPRDEKLCESKPRDRKSVHGLMVPKWMIDALKS